MKRTLIAAALSTLFVGAAQAEYSIYGLVDISVGKSISDDQANPKNRVNLHSGGDGGSGEGNSTTRLGVKGSTDVGSGLKVNFKFETGGIGSDGSVPVDANHTFFNRQAWAGVSGGFGELRFGKQDSVPFQAFGDYDYNGFSNGVSAITYVGILQTKPFGRQTRSLQYISPSMGGLKGQLGLQLKSSNPADKFSKDVVSGALTYAGGGLSVTGAFQSKSNSKDDPNAGLDEINDYFGIAAGYDFGVAKITAGYHDVKDAKGITVGAQTTLSGVNLGAIYAKVTKLKGSNLVPAGTPNGKGGVLELFVNKEVFKNTYAYAEVGIADKKVATPAGSGKGTGYALGMIYTF